MFLGVSLRGGRVCPQVPHYYLSIDCRMDALMTTRAKLNAAGDVKISVNDFVIKVRRAPV